MNSVKISETEPVVISTFIDQRKKGGNKEPEAIMQS